MSYSAKYRRQLPVYLSIALVLTVSTSRADDDFPTLRNTERDANAVPLPAKEAAAKMEVPAGFRVNVFAAEPDVQNPIASTWDARGRLWVAENYTYAERTQRFELGLRDRVIILDDTDGDGTADKRTVFTDQVQMLTSVEVGHGGVWLMCPPAVLFIPDRDGDDVPDGPAEVVLDGFEVAKENYHNFANGLRWGPDGWLYGRCGGSCPGRIGVPGTPDNLRFALEGGIWRYHPQRKQVEVLTHGTTNPWGLDWNEYGDAFFVNTVNGHLWHLIPGAHLMRPFTLDPNSRTYELIDLHADHWHFDTGKSWQDSRDGAANSLGGGHAHSGTMIYLGDNWPDEFRGGLLTLNFHGRRANHDILKRRGSGYVASHGKDTMLSADPFFRGIDLSYGPDGSVYVLDWSDTGECHENTGVHRTSGRVFRVTYDGNPNNEVRSKFNLRTKSDAELIALHTVKNEWFARQARLVLAERAASGRNVSGAESSLKRNFAGFFGGSALPTVLSGNSTSIPVDVVYRFSKENRKEVIDCRAFLTLHAIGGADREFLLAQLKNTNEDIRAWSVRFLTDSWPIDDVFGPVSQPKTIADQVTSDAHLLIDRLVELGKTDASSLVRLTLASTIQRLPLSLRSQLAKSLVSRAEDADDHNLPLLVWYGLIPVADADLPSLISVAEQCRWPKTQRFIARRIAEGMEKNPSALDGLLDVIVNSQQAGTSENLLNGIADGLKGWRKAAKPKNWDAVVAKATSSGNAEAIQQARELSVVFGDGRAIEEVRRIVLDEKAEIGVRRSALEALVVSRPDDLKSICLRLLGDARLNVIAARGLAFYNDPEIGQQLVRSYRSFRGPERPQIIAMLVSRTSYASALLDAIAAGRIPATELTAFDVRQIRSLTDDQLSSRVSQLWGEVRESPAEKKAKIESLKTTLSPKTLEAADKSRGRALFKQTCVKCHRLYGDGELIGPDLTGGNRQNLDYLLENILDPSAVLSKDFRMTVVALADGRVLNGLVTAKNDKTLILQTQTERRTIELTEIESTKLTNQSPMPDGLLDNLSPNQIRDLMAYLMFPSQVALPAEAEQK